MPDEPFRILSLNGGGIRGLFQAIYLDLMRAKLEENFWTKFNLIVGSSAGAIVGACLCKGKAPSHIATLFSEKGPTIFPRLFLAGLRIKMHAAKTYTVLKNAGLKKLLNEELNSHTLLGDLKSPKLAVTATELENSNIRVFSKMTQEQDGQLNLVDVVMASSALPGCFPSYAFSDGGKTRHYIDGGIWANAASLAGVGLAVENGFPITNIRVVSIGTAGYFFPSSVPDYKKLTVGSKNFYEYLFNLGFSASEHVQHEAVERLIGRDNYLHIDAPLGGKHIEAWHVKDAKRELPVIAETLSKNNTITDKLKRLVID